MKKGYPKKWSSEAPKGFAYLLGAFYSAVHSSIADIRVGSHKISSLSETFFEKDMRESAPIFPSGLKDSSLIRNYIL